MQWCGLMLLSCYNTFWESLMISDIPSEQSYKCLRRRNAPPPLHHHYCYTLTGIARTLCSPLDLYLLFFPKYHTKNYEQQLRIAQRDYKYRESEEAVLERNLSVFFLAFCRHFVLHCLLGQDEKQDEFAINLYFDFIYNHPNEKALGEVLRKLIKEICQKYQAFFKDSPNKQRTWPKTQEILKEIHANIDRLIKQVEQNSYVEYKPNKAMAQEEYEQMPPKRLVDLQYFAECKDKNILCAIIRRNFEHISNIHALRFAKRVHLLQNFHEEYRNLLSVKIPILKERKEKEDFTNKGEENKVYMLRNTNEQYPVITALPIFLNNIHKPQKQLNFTIARRVIKLFKQFRREAKHPFPNLKSKSVLIDQKSLKPIYEQSQLIFDGLGVSGNTNTIELDIALNATAAPIDYEQCHLEWQEEVRWVLNKKYYEVKRKEEMNDDNPQDLILLQGREVSEKVLLENIHVWRLLCVLYTIFNVPSQHPPTLASHIYGPKPFYRDQYLLALKTTYESVRQARMNVRQLLNIPPQQSIEKQPFDFTMEQLCEEFEVSNDDDSMLVNLRFESLNQELSLRVAFLHEIMGLMMSDRYFRKLANPKKYFIAFFVLASQSFYESALSAHLEIQTPGIRLKFIRQCLDSHKLSYSSDFEQRLPGIQGKLKQYQRRKDQNNAYVMSHRPIMKNISELGEVLKEISQKDALLREREIMADLEPQSKEEKKRYSTLLSEVKRQSMESFDTCVKTLDSYIKDEIKPQMGNLKEFHRLQDLSREGKANDELGKLLIHRFILLIEGYTRLRHYNWRAYDTLIQSALFDHSGKCTLRPLHRMSQGQIEKLTVYLPLAEQKISDFSVEQLHFHKESLCKKRVE